MTTVFKKISVVLGAVALFLIGIEPLLPAIKELLPESIAPVAAILIPMLIVAAKVYEKMAGVIEPLVTETPKETDTPKEETEVDTSK